jgi:hypothetical protein
MIVYVNTRKQREDLLMELSWLFKQGINKMIKDIILSLLFFTGVLVALLLGWGAGADFENTKVLSLLLASGIIFGAVFVVFYKELSK